MNLELKDKVVWITGGSKGIGLACARAFLAEGAKVAITSRSAENLSRAMQSLGQCLAVAADLIPQGAAAATAGEIEQRLGPIDVLINSAGAARRTLPEELTAAAWHAAMDAKYFTYIHAMDAVLPKMAARGQGNVVNIIGMGGKAATTYHLPGGAANSALMLASVGLASADGPKGVRVNAINPGATITERIEEALKLEAKAQGLTEAEVLARGEARVPLRRYAKPEEIAEVALFLASARASYVSGAIVPMDGALTAVI